MEKSGGRLMHRMPTWLRISPVYPCMHIDILLLGHACCASAQYGQAHAEMLSRYFPNTSSDQSSHL